MQYVYDGYGRLKTKGVRTAAGSPGTWIDTDYDCYPDGSTWKVTDARGVTVEYKFFDDNAVYSGRLSEIDFPTDSSILWSYDATTGYALRVDQGSASVLWSYNNFGQRVRAQGTARAEAAAAPDVDLVLALTRCRVRWWVGLRHGESVRWSAT